MHSGREVLNPALGAISSGCRQTGTPTSANSFKQRCLACIDVLVHTVFGTTATSTLVASVPVLLFCPAFGLSMDYEVFLISRIRESWLATGKTRADNDESVALGLARTSRVARRPRC